MVASDSPGTTDHGASICGCEDAFPFFFLGSVRWVFGKGLLAMEVGRICIFSAQYVWMDGSGWGLDRLAGSVLSGVYFAVLGIYRCCIYVLRW